MIYVPTTLTDDPQFLQEEIHRFAEFSPKPERFQLDIIDGEFADNLTVEPGIVHELEMHGMKLDLHFMVMEPLEWLSEIQNCPTIDIVIAQIERMTSIEAFVDEVKNELGYRAGLALDAFTPFSAIPKEILSELAIVQIMANTAGFSGKEFRPQTVDIIREAAAAKEQYGYQYEISVDIGMNKETAALVESAGATMVQMNSYLSGPNAEQRWQELQK